MLLKFIFKFIVPCFFLFFNSKVIASDVLKCIGQICLYGKNLPLKIISEPLGFTKNYIGGEIAYRCYSIKPDAFLRVGYIRGDKTVVSILLSESESCMPEKRSNLNVKHLVTENGVGLGSAMKEVKDKYGEPLEIVGPEIAFKRWLSTDSGAYRNRGDLDELWIYGSDVNTSLVRGFAIYHDRVISIFLQDSP